MDASSNDAFTIVGAGYRAHQPAIRKKGFWARLKGKPTLSVAVFSVIALGCLFSNLIINHDPAELFLMNVNEAPNAEFWFGTDSLGRDIYSIIWYGGRASIFIGLMSAAVITLIGVSYGCLSGVASGVVDSAMMRAVELLQSVPVLLSLLLILSLMGKQNELTIALVIGVTGYVEYSLQTAGLAYIEASRSAFITAFYVPLVPLFEWLIMRRRPGRMALIGLALAFPGVILLSGMDVSGGLGRGELLTIGCAIVYALEIIVIAMIVPGTDPRRVTLVELVVTALLAGASMPLNGESVSLSPYVLAAGIGLGVCTALIQSVIAWAQKSVPPTKATLIYTGEPVWGGVIGCLYGERLTLSSLAGCALVLAGILISERPEKKAGQPAEKAE